MLEHALDNLEQRYHMPRKHQETTHVKCPCQVSKREAPGTRVLGALFGVWRQPGTLGCGTNGSHCGRRR
eukprot:3207625-Prymnesium_polylepis.1